MKYDEFYEELNIQSKAVVQKFIKDYGVDGEKLNPSIASYHKSKNQYKTKSSLRRFCADCTEKKCAGKDWATCEYRISLLTAVNKELARQNLIMKEWIDGNNKKDTHPRFDA